MALSPTRVWLLTPSLCLSSRQKCLGVDLTVGLPKDQRLSLAHLVSCASALRISSHAWQGSGGDKSGYCVTWKNYLPNPIIQPSPFRISGTEARLSPYLVCHPVSHLAFPNCKSIANVFKKTQRCHSKIPALCQD